MSEEFRLRDAGPGDVSTVLHFIKQLAIYEKLAHEVEATEESLQRWMFGPEAVAEAILAETPAGPVGFALFYRSFSTFMGAPGFYLEDLYVDEAARGRGLGKALIVAGAKRAIARGCRKYHWQVLDWNQSARDFYAAMGASESAAWLNVRIDGEALAALAARDRT
jgi:GNAT superfamily N-acetyltransferase